MGGQDGIITVTSVRLGIERDGVLIGVLTEEVVFVVTLDGDVKKLLWGTLLWPLYIWFETCGGFPAHFQSLALISSPFTVSHKYFTFFSSYNRIVSLDYYVCVHHRSRCKEQPILNIGPLLVIYRLHNVLHQYLSNYLFHTKKFKYKTA